jgi:hypothetical protein
MRLAGFLPPASWLPSASPKMTMTQDVVTSFVEGRGLCLKKGVCPRSREVAQKVTSGGQISPVYQW